MTAFSPTLLAFDTSGPACRVALLRGDDILADVNEEMARGQAERLIPLLEEVLAAHDLRWPDVDALGVGTGPGNFTGIRISVAAARGLSLALNIPAVGVPMFEVLRFGHEGSTQVIILEGPRGSAYVQSFEGEVAQGLPRQIDPSEAPTVAPKGATVIGYKSAEMAASSGATALGAPAPDIAPTIARIAARRLLSGADLPAPAPLYVRAADAAPPRDAPPVIVP